MAKLQAPGLGPIVGHTTRNTAGIWIRAGSDLDDGGESERNLCTVAAIRVTHRNGERLDPTPTFYFRLRRDFDRTGTIVLGTHTPGFELEPGTHCIVKVGYLILDNAYDDEDELESEELLKRLPPSSAWADDLGALDPWHAEAPEDTTPHRMSFLMGPSPPMMQGLPTYMVIDDQLLVIVPRKAEVVLRLLRGEDIREVSREVRVAPRELDRWRRLFLDGGQQGLKGRNGAGGELM